MQIIRPRYTRYMDKCEEFKKIDLSRQIQSHVRISDISSPSQRNKRGSQKRKAGKRKT